MHIKVDICSNKSINDVFFKVIQMAQEHKHKASGESKDSKGAIKDEQQLSKDVKSK